MKIAVVFPVPQNLVDRLFNDKRNVFVKYLPHPTSTSLQPNDKIIFYASHASRQVVGEGTVEKVEFLNVSEAVIGYGDKIFLSESELFEYTALQPSRDPSKKMLVIVLTDIKKYKKPITYPRPLTMAGEYLTKSLYNKLMKRR